MEHRIIHCYAEGRGNAWEAFCLDFDLAVQGRTFEDVYQKLNDQIVLYIEHVATLPEADRTRLLNRSMPFTLRAGFFWRFLLSSLFQRDGKSRHEFTRPMSDLPCAA